MFLYSEKYNGEVVRRQTTSNSALAAFVSPLHLNCYAAAALDLRDVTKNIVTSFQ